MQNLNPNELQILDGLNTSEEVLVAIQDVTGTRFIEDGKINKNSDAFKVWQDPSNALVFSYSEECVYMSLLFDNVMVRAWELADDDTEYLCWGDYIEP